MNIQSTRMRQTSGLRETNAELSLRQYGTETCESGHFYRGIRDHWLLHLVLEGKGRFGIGGEAFAVEKGGAFLIPPHTDNWYRADDAEPWRYYWIGFSGTQAPILLRAAGFRDGKHVLTLKNVEALVAIIEDMPDYDPDDYAQHLVAQGHLFMFLGELVRTNGDSYFRYSPLVADALERIHIGYAALTVEGLAADVGASRATLYRAFMREIGMSPQAYLIDYRLQASVAAFGSGKSLAEIAYECGFNNYTHFIELFRQKYGESPATRRKRMRSD